MWMRSLAVCLFISLSACGDDPVKAGVDQAPPTPDQALPLPDAFVPPIDAPAPDAFVPGPDGFLPPLDAQAPCTIQELTPVATCAATNCLTSPNVATCLVNSCGTELLGLSADCATCILLNAPNGLQGLGECLIPSIPTP